jgi:dihydroflavonol-4-reductase
MKIAITGASGFIGNVLVPLLLAEGHTLRALTRSSRKEDSITFVTGDMLQEECLKELVAGVDVVIHLAAIISIDDLADEDTFRVNTSGTRLLLATAKTAGVKRFIHISSVAAFNQFPYEERMDESRSPANATEHNYDTSKAISQGIVLAANDTDFEVIVLAPSAVTGPFDHKPSLLGKAMLNIYKGKIPALFPGGVDFVDVRDVAAAIVSSLTRGTPGRVYLLSGQWVSLRSLSEEIGIVKGKKISLAIMPLWLVFGMLPLVRFWSRITGGPPYYTKQSVYNLIYSNQKIDHSRAQSELQFHPRPFSETVRDTITWFRQNGYLK